MTMPSPRTARHRIFKYPLEVEHRQLVHMPESAVPLWVTEQGQQLVLYAQVDWPEPGATKVRVFQIVTTGDEYSAEDKLFIGACTLGGWFQAFVFELDMVPGAEHTDKIDRRHADDFIQIKQEHLVSRRGQ